ncbi:MAG: sulfite exporter TauE/SafE family protein, partial [Gammaproteobacteria bacterium]
LPMHAAVGTSLLVITMKCFAGLAGYITHVPVDLESGIIVSALAIAGTVLGSRLSKAVSGTQLRQGFGVFVLVIAAILVVIEGSRLLAHAWHLDRHVMGALLGGVEALLALGFLVWRASNASHAHPQH